LNNNKNDDNNDKKDSISDDDDDDDDDYDDDDDDNNNNNNNKTLLEKRIWYITAAWSKWEDRYSRIQWFKFKRNETERVITYKDLEIEVSGMWKVRTKIVTIIIGALGTVKKG